MTLADFQPILQAVADGIALLITGLIAIFVPRAIKAFEDRTGVQLTDQQRATVLGAAQTEAGIIRLRIDQGLLTLAEVHPGSPLLLEHAAAAIDRVPEAAEAMRKTTPSMSQTIVGMLGNSPKPPAARDAP